MDGDDSVSLSDGGSITHCMSCLLRLYVLSDISTCSPQLPWSTREGGQTDLSGKRPRIQTSGAIVVPVIAWNNAESCTFIYYAKHNMILTPSLGSAQP